MQRNIIVAQKHALDLHESGVFAQTIQIKCDCIFCMAQKHKEIIFSRSKIRNKNPRHDFFRFYIVL